MSNRRYGRGAQLAAVSAACALMLAACGGGTQETETSAAPETSGAEETSAEETSAEEPAGDAIQIEYLHRLPDGDGMTPVAEIVEKWNE